MRSLALAVVAGATLAAQPAHAYVELMAGQTARPLQGRFNNVPVLHSNQPEEVLGPGILVNTAPGSAITAETNQSLANATYTFNGEFGLHVHHKYNPQDTSRMGYGGVRRGELTLATILINPSDSPVTLRFEQGAVRNSFEAPYLPNYLMGVKPLGPRPWNTGPGDATAIQMLRRQLDRRLTDAVVIPPRSRLVLFSTQLPAKGIANGLLRGRSDGPFQMAVVAAQDPRSDADIVAVLDQGRLAPGRIYLSRLAEIQNRTVFSRVAGVSIGDAYQAELNHDLAQGPLHVPLTSTNRHNFGTGEIQVNPLASRMLDSSLDNVGTYGVRFDLDFGLRGSGPYELVFSHPTANGRTFTAFRGSIGIETDEGYREVHVGMRSGESLPIATLNLQPGQNNRLKVSLVYPADATPGHLLSVVPASQLAQLQQRQRQLEVARAEAVAARRARPAAAPPAIATGQEGGAAQRPAPAPRRAVARPANAAPAAPAVPASRPVPRPRPPQLMPAWIQPLPPMPLINRSLGAPDGVVMGVAPASLAPVRMSQLLMERYQQAVDDQQVFMKGLMGR
uniref:DUF3370 family protein n=2 Tax=Vulcanococcus limneticus TaxID=2170428 RepID=UPI0036F3766B